MTRLRQMKGFTLIELIVVVIIIGVLAAIAAVAYNQFVDNSRKTALDASAKQVQKYVSAKSASADKGADQLTDAADYKFATNISGATVVQGTTSKFKFLVTNGRQACVSFAAGVAGDAGTISTVPADITACV